MGMMRGWVIVGAMVMGWMGMAMGGCSAYVGDFGYVPRPAVVEVAAVAPQLAPPVVSMASVVGVRREDKKAGVPESVEVALRVENDGARPVEFDPATMELTNGDLMEFGKPLLTPDTKADLAQGQAAMVHALFGFPAGRDYTNVDMSTLQLRWVVTIDGQRVRQVASFTRVVPVYTYYGGYYDPYWGGPWYGPGPYYWGRWRRW